MNDHVTDRLTESLRTQAGRVEPRPSIEAGARDRARRIRRHRRVLTGAAAIVAVAVVLPFGLATIDGSHGRRTEIAPVGTSTPAPAGDPITVALDLDKLPAGDAPEIEWYANGVIHDGDQEIPIGELPNEDHEVYFAATAYGYVVTISTDLAWTDDGATTPKYETRLVTANGAPTELVTDGMPVVSADGRTLAWGQRPAPSRAQRPMRLTTADARTGEVLERSPVVARAEQLPALGFVDGLVVFSADSETGDFTGTWDPGTGDVNEVEGMGWSDDLSKDGLLLGWPSSKSGDCVGTFGLVADTGEGSWHDCQLSLAKFAGAGSYAVAPSEGELIDPSTGEPLLRIRHQSTVGLSHFQTEPNGDILFRARRGGDEALVRCSTDGECELARGIHEGEYPDPYYALIN